MLILMYVLQPVLMAMYPIVLLGALAKIICSYGIHVSPVGIYDTYLPSFMTIHKVKYVNKWRLTSNAQLDLPCKMYVGSPLICRTNVGLMFC